MNVCEFSNVTKRYGDIIAQWIYGEQLIRRVSDASWQNGTTAGQRWENAILRNAK